MSAPKWTPGPWKAFAGAATVGVARDAGTDVGLIAAMNTGRSEAIQNAHLIAAAPELLEALKWAIRRLEISIGPSHCCGAHWERAQAAIAKAEGRSE